MSVLLLHRAVSARNDRTSSKKSSPDGGPCPPPSTLRKRFGPRAAEYSRSPCENGTTPSAVPWVISTGLRAWPIFASLSIWL